MELHNFRELCIHTRCLYYVNCTYKYTITWYSEKEYICFAILYHALLCVFFSRTSLEIPEINAMVLNPKVRSIAWVDMCCFKYSCIYQVAIEGKSKVAVIKLCST